MVGAQGAGGAQPTTAARIYGGRVGEEGAVRRYSGPFFKN